MTKILTRRTAFKSTMLLSSLLVLPMETSVASPFKSDAEFINRPIPKTVLFRTGNRKTLETVYHGKKNLMPLFAETYFQFLQHDPYVWEFTLKSSLHWDDNLSIEVSIPLNDAMKPDNIAFADYHGFFAQHSNKHSQAAFFRGPGRSPEPTGSQRLSLPLAILQIGGTKWLVGTDPGFSTTLRLDIVNGQTKLVIAWDYLAAAGLHDIKRRIFIQQIENDRTALDAWFQLALPQTSVPPAWLQSVAFQNYDYLSNNGDGWFRDIDAACKLIAKEDRNQALFCLHGWYDEVGRYCFDTTTGKLDDNWSAMPFINDPEILSLNANGPNQVCDGYQFRNLEKYRPVPMNWNEIVRRLQYARDRGFRTGFYLMTGMQGKGELNSHLLDGTGVPSRSLWIGPDSKPPHYARNPLHPDVRKNVLAYLDAIIAKVGDYVDAFAYDEAYYISQGALGPAAAPGYADQAQASLIAEMAMKCHLHRPDLALMTADLLGYQPLQNAVYPYSLYCDGIYQDAHGALQSLDAMRFVNWRSVGWNCNWAPKTNFDLIEWSVRAHGAAIAWSNGCFGDDTGLAEIDTDLRTKFKSLWDARKNKIWSADTSRRQID